MARKPMVTRTFSGTEVEALVFNLESNSPENKTVILSETYKDDKAMRKALEKVINSDAVRFIKVITVKTVEKRYGMDENEFIKHAHEIPLLKANEAEE